jgi:hypothetical protein
MIIIVPPFLEYIVILSIFTPDLIDQVVIGSLDGFILDFHFNIPTSF